MARWEAGAAERLRGAALELFASRGFEQTTAKDVAQAVGLTERTFFRHFTDKREVLFAGQDEFAAAFLAGAAAVPAGAPPMGVVASALQAGSALFTDERRAPSRTRQAVIDVNPPLQEREQHKLARLAAALGDALRARGVDEPAATLAAESGVTVFTVAFAAWLREDEERSLDDVTADVLRQLSAVTGAVEGGPAGAAPCWPGAPEPEPPPPRDG